MTNDQINHPPRSRMTFLRRRLVLLASVAGIAFVDRRIDLNVVVVRARADVAPLRRYDAGGYRAAKTKRVADGHDPIADARRPVFEIHVSEAGFSVDFDECEVSLGICADDFSGVDGAIIGRDLNRLRVIDNVIIGHGIAVR